MGFERTLGTPQASIPAVAFQEESSRGGGSVGRGWNFGTQKPVGARMTGILEFSFPNLPLTKAVSPCSWIDLESLCYSSKLKKIL